MNMQRYFNSPAIWFVPAATVWLAPADAFAYVGPGAGITMIGALVGVILAVASMIGALLFWPVRALLRRRKAAAGDVAQDEGEQDSTDR